MRAVAIALAAIVLAACEQPISRHPVFSPDRSASVVEVAVPSPVASADAPQGEADVPVAVGTTPAAATVKVH